METLGGLHRRLAPALVLVLVLVLAGCGSAPPPTPPPAREQVRPIALEVGGLAYLDQAPEVVVAHHERAPLFNASTCDTRALDYAGSAFGLIGAVAALGVACMGPDDGLYVGVAATVRDWFVQSLSPQAVAAKIESPTPSLESDSVAALRQSFGDRPVIDFTTVDWQKTTAGGVSLFVPSTVRGRLVDVADGRVLWEEACAIAMDRVPENLGAVHGALEGSAALCAEQFAAQFAKARPVA